MSSAFLNIKNNKCQAVPTHLFVSSEYNEEIENFLLVVEKGDTDFATVIRNRTSLNAINPTFIRFYWQEMLKAVGEIQTKVLKCLC